MPNIQTKYGTNCWALVTGSTDGIGKAYCQILAKQNVNICLVARNEKKAQNVIKELSIGSTSQFKIVIADFTNSLEIDFFDQIYEQVKSLDIGLLINNVGLSVKQSLEKHQVETLHSLIKVNCYPIVFLTKKLLPQLKNRKRSAIINLSSMAGRRPIPFHQTYSATKAFDDYFTRSLALENSNIDVLSHRPLFVTTPLTNYEKGAGAISAIECARGGLQRLGLESASHGHWKHRLQGFLISRVIPDFISTYVTKSVIKKRVKQD